MKYALALLCGHRFHQAVVALLPCAFFMAAHEFTHPLAGELKASGFDDVGADQAIAEIAATIESVWPFFPD